MERFKQGEELLLRKHGTRSEETVQYEEPSDIPIAIEGVHPTPADVVRLANGTKSLVPRADLRRPDNT